MVTHGNNHGHGHVHGHGQGQWHRHVGDGNVVYFYNDATNETSWEPPPGFEHLLEDGDLERGGVGGTPEEDPSTTYEGLLNYDAGQGQEEGTRGLRN